LSRRREFSGRHALAPVIVAIVGLIAFLYLTTFAGILIAAYLTGEFVIKGDRLMLLESLLLVSASAWIASMVVTSLKAIGSQIRTTPRPLREQLAARAATAMPDRARAAPGAEAQFTALSIIQDQVP